jgi:hypothetical protein
VGTGPDHTSPVRRALDAAPVRDLRLRKRQESSDRGRTAADLGCHLPRSLHAIAKGAEAIGGY